MSIDSFKTRKNFELNGKIFSYFSLNALERQGLCEVQRLPCILKLLVENLLRFEDGEQVNKADIKALARGIGNVDRKLRILLHPSHVWLTSFSEAQDEKECHTLLTLGGKVIPPFRVDLNPEPEFLVSKERDGVIDLFPENLIGTGNFVASANAMGVLGIKVTEVAAEVGLLGQPIFLSIPEVFGFKVEEGDPVKILQSLEEKGVLGVWLEFYGQGLDQLSYQDRVLISNGAMALGAVCAFFPIDQEALRHVQHAELVQNYAVMQGLWRDNTTPDPVFGTLLSQAVTFSSTHSKRPERIVLEDKVGILPVLSSPFNGSNTTYALVTSPEEVFPVRKIVSLGGKVVLAEWFDSDYRADLIYLNILPLLFKFGMSRSSLQIVGGEHLEFLYLSHQIRPGMDVLCRITRQSGAIEEFVLKCAIETQRELGCFQWGGDWAISAHMSRAAPIDLSGYYHLNDRSISIPQMVEIKRAQTR